MKEEELNEEEQDITADDDIDSTPDNFNDFGGGFDDFGDEGASQKHAELLKQLMDFSPYLRQKFEKWVNIRWDEKTEAYVENEYGYPIMNIQGASWAISFIDTYARDNNMITHIGEEDYNYFKEDLINVVWPNIYNRHEEFGIIETGDCNRVSIEILHSALLVLMGSGDGKAAKILTDTTHRSENIQYGQPAQMAMIAPPVPKRAGFFGKIKKAFGGTA